MEFIDKAIIKILKATKLCPNYVKDLEAETPLVADKLASLGKYLTGLSASLVGLDQVITVFPPHLQAICETTLGVIAVGGIVLTAVFKAKTV